MLDILNDVHNYTEVVHSDLSSVKSVTEPIIKQNVFRSPRYHPGVETTYFTLTTNTNSFRYANYVSRILSHAEVLPNPFFLSYL